MICGESELLLHALIDGELDSTRAHQVEAHVKNCSRCAEALSAYRKMREAIRPLRLRALAIRNLGHCFPK
jgi:anti-sigma factor RsiW